MIDHATLDGREPAPQLWSFNVPGPYGTKGSTVSFVHRGRVVTKTDSKHDKTFATAVQWAARLAGVTLIPKGTGVSVTVVYRFLRPIGKDRHRRYPSIRPDLDKLLRALLDALTGVCYADDGQVVNTAASKIYADRMVATVIVRVES